MMKICETCCVMYINTCVEVNMNFRLQVYSKTGSDDPSIALTVLYRWNIFEPVCVSVFSPDFRLSSVYFW